jgi:hypothetical protein
MDARPARRAGARVSEPLPVDDALKPWRDAWPAALATWSRFTRLQDPRLCRTQTEASKEGLSGSFAMIRLIDQRVVIDLEEIARLDLADYALEILAHEIGHHVLAPATATDHARLVARIRRALPTLEAHAPMVANLYADLLINDRLQRQSGLRMADIYRRIAEHRNSTVTTPMWMLYMGIYEQLWQQTSGTLGGPVDDDAMKGDAWLGARVVRAYADDWLDGSTRFAALLLPYLVQSVSDPRVDALMDTRHAGQGSQPVGLDRIDDDELTPVLHPALDPRITGEKPHEPPGEDQALPDASTLRHANGGAQAREPFEYGEILRAAGLNLSDHDMAVRYYRERALPHLIRFPTRPQPQAMEPQMEGLEPWELGDPLDALDWMQTVLQSPRVIPGLTTVQRTYGLAPGREPASEPVDLDLYVDSSGSMPNPQTHTSYLALAGAVIALSALRVGSRVQVTLWSGKQQELHTEGFVRSEDAILRVLTGFFGGATAFPIHRLRDTYATRTPRDRAVHILHLSDDGITTMFANDERGNSGWNVAANALRMGRAGGTMALNLYRPLPEHPAEAKAGWASDLLRARSEGWAIHVVRDMAELLAFARDFSQRHYGTVRA